MGCDDLLDLGLGLGLYRLALLDSSEWTALVKEHIASGSGSSRVGYSEEAHQYHISKHIALR